MDLTFESWRPGRPRQEQQYEHKPLPTGVEFVPVVLAVPEEEEEDVRPSEERSKDDSIWAAWCCGCKGKACIKLFPLLLLGLGALLAWALIPRGEVGGPRGALPSRGGRSRFGCAARRHRRNFSHPRRPHPPS